VCWEYLNHHGQGLFLERNCLSTEQDRHFPVWDRLFGIRDGLFQERDVLNHNKKSPFHNRDDPLHERDGLFRERKKLVVYGNDGSRLSSVIRRKAYWPGNAWPSPEKRC
jgi:hypothetical protein